MGAPTVEGGHALASADEDDVHTTNRDGMRFVGCQVVQGRHPQCIRCTDTHDTPRRGWATGFAAGPGTRARLLGGRG